MVEVNLAVIRVILLNCGCRLIGESNMYVKKGQMIKKIQKNVLVFCTKMTKYLNKVKWFHTTHIPRYD